VIGRQARWPRRWRRVRRRWRLSLIIIDFLWRFGFCRRTFSHFASHPGSFRGERAMAQGY
jgi:hypothetical protein